MTSLTISYCDAKDQTCATYSGIHLSDGEDNAYVFLGELGDGCLAVNKTKLVASTSITVSAEQFVEAMKNFIEKPVVTAEDYPEPAYRIYKDAEGDYRFYVPVPHTTRCVAYCLSRNTKSMLNALLESFNDKCTFVRCMTPKEIVNGMDKEAFIQEVGL